VASTKRSQPPLVRVSRSVFDCDLSCPLNHCLDLVWSSQYRYRLNSLVRKHGPQLGRRDLFASRDRDVEAQQAMTPDVRPAFR
jgi:hypothetical protein